MLAMKSSFLCGFLFGEDLEAVGDGKGRVHGDGDAFCSFGNTYCGSGWEFLSLELGQPGAFGFEHLDCHVADFLQRTAGAG